MTILALIAGGASGVATNMIFQGGLAFPAAPGSIIAVTVAAIGAGPANLLVVYLSVVVAAAVTFLVAGVILRASRKRDQEAEGDSFAAAIDQTAANKGKESSALGALRTRAAGTTGSGTTETADRDVDAALGGLEGGAVATKQLNNIVFACDAGMGSSAMGASVLRNKIKKAGIDGVTVTNQAIANLDGSADLVITQNQLTDRAKAQSPDSVHVSVDNFMNSPRYDEVVEMVRAQHEAK